ncbi:MAG: hypothetical protein IT362_06790 [Deltaproteobacteria bacterium]|nr:hypothetical protein [Deltaproteobacteria bacterium]
MTNLTFVTISNIVIFIGAIFVAFGTFGHYFFNQRIEQEKGEKQAYVGKLEPETKLKLSAHQQIFPQLEFGDSGSILKFAGKPGQPLFKIFEDTDLTVVTEDGHIKISIVIRDKTGKVIAEIVKNEWKVNPSGSWDRNYSPNALEVKDSQGDIVLQVKLVEDRIQFQAKLYDSEGQGVGFSKIRTPEGWGGMLTRTDDKNDDLPFKIEPIFKYPSELHLGELLKK